MSTSYDVIWWSNIWCNIFIVLQMRVLALANRAIFWKAPKPTWLWQSAVTKPLQLQTFQALPWKDNIHIFHLAPGFLKSTWRYSCDDFLKKVASSGHFRYQEFFSNFHQDFFNLWENISTSIISTSKYFNLSLIFLLWWNNISNY